MPGVPKTPEDVSKPREADVIIGTACEHRLEIFGTILTVPCLRDIPSLAVSHLCRDVPAVTRYDIDTKIVTTMAALWDDLLTHFFGGFFLLVSRSSC